MMGVFGFSSGRRLVMGFMVATPMLSMWISNAATTLMMLPVGLAVLDAVDDKSSLGPPLMLGIAYAASIGELGTPIGTPPNLIFMQVYEQTTGQTIGFIQWMGWAVPIVVLMVPATAMILTRNLGGALQLQLPEAGPWRTHERRVMLVFVPRSLAENPSVAGTDDPHAPVCPDGHNLSGGHLADRNDIQYRHCRTAALLMPVLAAGALAAGIAPELMMVPAVMSASLGFMLPVGTAPNTIVFGSGLVTTGRMAREGLLINLLGVALVSSVCFITLT